MNDEIEAALAELKTCLLRYPGFVSAMDSVSTFVQRTTRTGDGRVLFLCGESGAGKSVIARETAKALGGVESASETPVAFVEVPADASPKNLVEEMLRAVRDPMPIRGTKVTLQGRIKPAYDGRKVRCIIIDEAQRIRNLRTEHQVREVANTIVSIIDDLRRPVVLVGTPELLRVHDQFMPLARRTASIVEISPFPCNPSRADGLRTLIHSLNHKLPIKLPAWLLTPAGLEFLQDTTGGFIGLIIQLATRSAEIAFDAKSVHIEQHHMEAAGDGLRMRHALKSGQRKAAAFAA